MNSFVLYIHLYFLPSSNTTSSHAVIPHTIPLLFSCLFSHFMCWRFKFYNSPFWAISDFKSCLRELLKYLNKDFALKNICVIFIPQKVSVTGSKVILNWNCCRHKFICLLLEAWWLRRIQADSSRSKQIQKHDKIM